MSELVLADFCKSTKRNKQEVDISQVIADLAEARFRIQKIPIQDILDILESFSGQLRSPGNPVHRCYPNSGIPFVANWCRKSNLETVLKSAFPEWQCLDKFVDSQVSANRSYRLFPKGLVVHYMAGNVPTLGFLSVIQGMLTKNTNLVRVASGSDDMLATFLDIISKVHPKGLDLVSAVAVVRYDWTEKSIADKISQSADVRVIWGSDEAVADIRSLPHKLDAVDLVFPNKTSLILLGHSAFQKADLDQLARRIAIDVSVFEQKACASPHTIFLESSRFDDVKSLALALQEALGSALRTIPKVVPSSKEISAILNLRAQYDMFHQAWYSQGVEYSILHDDFFQIGPPIGNRTIYIRRVENLEKVAELISPTVQSVGLLADREQFEKITDLLGDKGVQRIIKIGTMTQFESPWDGIILPHHLVRWTSRYRIG